MSGEYDDNFISALEWIWGEGFLSPGGADEVAEILNGVDLSGKTVLDIGCGIGGVDILLAGKHGAAKVIAIDVDDALIARAKQNATRAGVAERIEFRKVTPGALPFDRETFDVVFSKDSLVHVADKKFLFQEVHRVLVHGGALAIGDWFGAEDSQAPAPALDEWLAIVGLSLRFAPIQNIADILRQAGFQKIKTRDRNAWYAQEIQKEITASSGANQKKLAAKIGSDAAEKRLQSALAKQKAVNAGQLRPGHLRGWKV